MPRLLYIAVTYMFFIQHRTLFFSIVGAITGLSLLAIAVWGVKLGTDFTGGSLAEIIFTEARPEKAELMNALTEARFEGVTIREAGSDGYIVRGNTFSEEQQKALQTLVTTEEFKGTIARTSTVGPTIGAELYSKALWAIFFVSLCILIYLAVAFRTPKAQRAEKRDGYGVQDVSSWWYGIVAVITLFHDMIVPVGFIAFLGYTTGAEIDALFITALLTILGYSVNDTIVIFDRIREKVRALQNQKNNIPPFDTIVGIALTETYGRSINTSLTVILALIALYVVGPETTKLFALMLGAGVVAGTYSSVMVSGPLLAYIHSKTRNG